MQSVVMDVDGIDVCECGPQLHAKSNATRYLGIYRPITINQKSSSLSVRQTLLSQGFETGMQLQLNVHYAPSRNRTQLLSRVAFRSVSFWEGLPLALLGPFR